MNPSKKKKDLRSDTIKEKWGFSEIDQH